jgi:hypothetical protein
VVETDFVARIVGDGCAKSFSPSGLQIGLFWIFASFPGNICERLQTVFMPIWSKYLDPKIQESRQTFGILDLVSNLGSRFLASKKFF